jgi:hypothetical protein
MLVSAAGQPLKQADYESGMITAWMIFSPDQSGMNFGKMREAEYLCANV